MAKAKFTKKKLFVIIIIAVFVLLLACVAAGVGYLTTQYNRSYERVDVVKRTDTYVMPEYPTLDEAPPEENTDEGTDFIEQPPEEAEPSKETPEKNTEEKQKTEVPVSKPKGNGKPLSVYKKIPIYEVEQKDKNVLNVLLLGTDSTDITTDLGRSDTMIVVSYNASEGTVKLTSILRDSLVPIEGHNWNKINTAFFFGGVGLAINTVNQLFDLDIQRFVVVDMNGFRKFIRRLGGVEIKLTKAEADFYNSIYNTELTAGMNNLDPRLALLHMRNRTVDSDFGRTRRQRDVIEAVVKKMLQEKTPAQVNKLIKYGAEMIRTNIELTDMLSLATTVIANKDKLKIESQSVPYKNNYRSTWYQRKAVLSFDIEDAATKINEFIYGSSGQ